MEKPAVKNSIANQSRPGTQTVRVFEKLMRRFPIFTWILTANLAQLALAQPRGPSKGKSYKIKTAPRFDCRTYNFVGNLKAYASTLAFYDS
jgi:hypothetical protein